MEDKTEFSGKNLARPLTFLERQKAVEELCAKHLKLFLSARKSGRQIAQEIARAIRPALFGANRSVKNPVADSNQYFWNILSDAEGANRIRIRQGRSAEWEALLEGNFPILRGGGARVVDCWGNHFKDTAEKVARAAAEEFLACLQDVLESKKSARRDGIHIGVVGGNTCRRTYKSLSGMDLKDYIDTRLLSVPISFYALNAIQLDEWPNPKARTPEYHNSQAPVIAANFAEFFQAHVLDQKEIHCLAFSGPAFGVEEERARFLAYNKNVLDVTDPGQFKNSPVKGGGSKLDIVIMGLGPRPVEPDSSVFASMLSQKERNDLKKENCVGDVMLYPIDKEGKTISLGKRRPLAAVRPETLRALAGDRYKHVMVVAFNDIHLDKTDVIRAVLRENPIANRLVTSDETVAAFEQMNKRQRDRD